MQSIFLVVLFWTVNAFAAENCSFGQAKQVIAKIEWGYSAVWTLDDQPSLYQPLQTGDKKFAELRRWIGNHTKEDWRAFLKRHIRAVEETINQVDPKDPGVAEFKADISLTNKILSGKVGTVHPLACLESIPYREFLQVVDLRKFPQEFNAVIYKREGKVKIIGDFYFTPGTSDPTGVEISEESKAAAARLVADGWKFYAHLHNHTFIFSKTNIDIGGELAPSGPDLELYGQEGQEKALISNGIDTIEFTRADIAELLRE